jgi:hypothetical protein
MIFVKNHGQNIIIFDMKDENSPLNQQGYSY